MKRLTLVLALMLSTLVCAEEAPSTTYKFENIKYPHDTFTQLLGINNRDEIAGYHGVNINRGFTLQLSDKKFTNENYPGSVQTQVIGINAYGETCGFYIDTAGVTHGFTDELGTFRTVDLPGTLFNQLLGRNDMEQDAGYYSETADGTGRDHAYIYDENGGTFEVLTIPNEVGGAQATGINLSGQVTGFFIDVNGVNHGFLLFQGTFTQLDYPNSTFTQALGENNSGYVVGAYTDVEGNTHGFVYNVSKATYQSIDDPDGVGTTIVNGINDKGQLVGFFGTSPINTGFVATPAASFN
jgi:hypothetical protein